MRISVSILYLFLSILSLSAIAQNNDPAKAVSEKSLNYINSKYTKLTSAINKQYAKLLNRMQRREEKLRKALASTDSLKAAELFANTPSSYQQLQNTLKAPLDKTIPYPLKEYLPNLDSLNTSINFLKKIPGLSSDKLKQVTAINDQLKQLQGSLQRANEIQVFLKEREQLLKNELSQYGLGKQLLGMNKQLVYYQQQFLQYKSLLRDKQKLEETILSKVRDLPAFQEFFKRNSYLSQLFGTPADYSNPASLAGLQTRALVQQTVQQRIGSTTTGGGASSVQSFTQQQMQGVQQQLGQLQNNVTRLDGGNSDLVMPDFKVNPEKTKTFLKRFEFGFNIQANNANNLAPSISDLALSVAYKINSYASAGVAISYKLGLGKPIDHIRISNEGCGFRSFFRDQSEG